MEKLKVCGIKNTKDEASDNPFGIFNLFLPMPEGGENYVY
jgi:hypothetical protein